ncbi:uncharacterized protein ColSpa_05194 [Colletotrichum spaethianum]|uniref:Uncharacterized protein n=1 Tax=Colletotrichum spaethianum TaxID=700344 RepID=A0AA37LAX7_9PEZI|nr:uncharacterized protein ColSpa_05194 [Colletotrichum spaethianum]GKT45013.1 hypothetical protein ColSpa_05194 [Colletotrichum spaethianum]
MSSPSKNPLRPISSTATTNLSSNPNTSINTTNTTKPIENQWSMPSAVLSPCQAFPAQPMNQSLKDAGLMVGIKLDPEAEVHLTARIRGDILVGLY